MSRAIKRTLDQNACILICLLWLVKHTQTHQMKIMLQWYVLRGSDDVLKLSNKGDLIKNKGA